MGRGVGVGREELAFDALRQLGPGGLFLEAEHTMLHFKEWLTMSPIFRTQDFATWEMAGSPGTAELANARWKELLARHEDPGIDEAVDEELQAFVERRKREPRRDED